MEREGDKMEEGLRGGGGNFYDLTPSRMFFSSEFKTIPTFRDSRHYLEDWSVFGTAFPPSDVDSTE